MPMTFDEFMEKFNAQGGPLPSAWSDEAIAEAQNKANMMGIAEFRPANARESKIAQMVRTLRHDDSADKKSIKKQLRKEVKKSELTPQMSDGTRYKDIIDNVFGKKTFETKIIPEIEKDMAMKGYDANTLRNKQTTDSKVMDDYNIDRIRNAWDDFNDLIVKREKERPEFLYHETSGKNVPSIGESGIIPGKEPANIRRLNRELQFGKSFFAEKPLGFITEAQDRALLRTRPNQDMNPDINGKLSWQTQKPIPPQALEIETAPGQWEPLLEYIRKRGNK